MLTPFLPVRLVAFTSLAAWGWNRATPIPLTITARHRPAKLVT